MGTNPLAMSDEDFLKQTPPESPAESSAIQESGTENNNNPDPNPDNADPNANQNEDKQADPVAEGDAGTPDPAVDPQADPEPEDEAGTENKPADPKPEGEKDPVEGGKPTDADPADTLAEAPNYEEAYKQIMAPFKANGKEIKLTDPKEAIQLMQMGANYTRKLQEMAPHRKIIAMLGNNDLLDESKLSFFIALDKKDPEAIKKLIIDSGIDPLDIDTKTESAYREGSYKVSDEELNFRGQLEELSSTDAGKETITIISAWDQASKDQLWEKPEAFGIIHSHRENGIYDLITTEMERQKTLGQIPATTPFLKAYETVGDKLHAAGAFNKIIEGNTTGTKTEAVVDQGTGAEKPVIPTPQKAVLGTSVATPKTPVSNGDKAVAASPTRAVPSKAKETPNYLAMSDEDFMKADALRNRV